MLYAVALPRDQKIFEGLAEESLRRGHALVFRGLAQLRPECTQDCLMGQALATGQTVDLDRLCQTRRNRLRQLAEKAAEHFLFVGADHAHAIGGR